MPRHPSIRQILPSFSSQQRDAVGKGLPILTGKSSPQIRLLNFYRKPARLQTCLLMER